MKIALPLCFVATTGLLLTASLAAPLPADTGVVWNLTAEQVTQACKARLDDAQATIRGIDARAAKGPGTPLLEQVEVVSADANDTLIAPSQLSQFGLAKDVRDASTRCDEDVATFNVALASDATIYAVAKKALSESKTPDTRRLAQLYVEVGRRSGAGLPPARRAEVARLLEELNKVQLAFMRALGEDHQSVRIDEHEATSLPAAFVKTLKPESGGYVVDVNESTINQFLDNEAVADARKRYYIAYNRRGGEENVKRLAQAVALRDKLSHLLGFKSWAAYQLDAKMAKSPDRVLKLLTQIDSGLLPKARSEIAVLTELKRAEGDATPFERWDYGYYENLLQKTRYAVDAQAIRQYFPVSKVIPAVFRIYENLLGVRFDPLVPAVAWAPDVLEYSVTDTATGEPLGWFFLDLYPREGKYDHFAMFPFRAFRYLPDGRAQLPISAIIGNWAVGEPGKPALLSHSEVITFFHEFGHLMHNSLAHTRFETTGQPNVRNDFVEAPSQMLENFMWQPAILKQVSSNVETGAPIPDEQIEKMIAAKHVADGFQFSSQAFYGIYDMRLHSSGATVDPTQLWFDLSPRLTTFAALPGTYPEAGFGHLMSGYDAGYYGYLWSLVYAQDIFSVFQKEGLANPVVGMRYRKDVLEPGALVEPDVLLRNFLGRPVSYEPFYRYLGITAH